MPSAKSKCIVLIILFLAVSLKAQDVSDLQKVNKAIQAAYDSSDYERTLRLVKNAVPLLDKLKNDSLEVDILSSGSLACDYLGYYDQCQEYNYRLLDIHTRTKDTLGLAVVLNDIAIVNYYKEDYDASLFYEEKAYELYKYLDDSLGIAMCLINLANCYADKGDPELGLKIYHEALELHQRLNDIPGVAICLGNIGETYHDLERNTEALIYYRKAISLCQEHKLADWYILSPYSGRAKLYLVMNLPERGLEDAQKALQIAEESRFRAEKSNALAIISNAYEKLGKHDIALQYFKRHASLEDSIYHDQSMEKIAELNIKYELNEKESELRLQEIAFHKQEELAKRNQQIIWVMVVAVLIIIAVVYFLFKENRKRQKTNELLNDKNKLIEEKNRDITESIVYARKIQNAILPETTDIQHSFPQSFILYKPKDIVSGDFYWFHRMGDISLLAVVDCTGHGVPGAFMSIMAANLLNQILLDESVCHPAEAFEKLDNRLKKNLRQTKNTVEGRDGFDISLITYHHNDGKIEFAGAKNDVYLIRNNELIVYKASRFSIGGSVIQKQFTGEDFYVEAGDQLYLFTDGLADQFGGAKNKKFSYRRFKEVLLAHHHLPMEAQQQQLHQFFEDWRGENEQIDDICMVGIKF